jgi:hypothetical protein
MTKPGACLAAALFCAVVAAQEVPTRDVIVSVVGADGKPVPDLRPDEFQVFVDDRRIPVVSVTRSDVPLSMAAVIDMSGSSRLAQSRFADERSESVVDGVLKDATAADTARLARVGGMDLFISPPLPLRTQPFTTRISEAHDCPVSSSPIWDAVAAAVHALTGDPHRRLVVLATDGRATATTLSVADAAHYALQMQTAVSVIDVGVSLTIPQWNGEVAVIEPAKALRWLAATTGGAYIPDGPALRVRAAVDSYPLVRRAIAARRHAYSVTLRLPAGAGNALSVIVTRPETTVLAPSLLDAPPVELSASLLARVGDWQKCK